VENCLSRGGQRKAIMQSAGQVLGGISGHELTQAEAIERAREIDPSAAVLVERVRYTDRGHPDKWRRP
jgi:hypothetical protein